MGSEQSKWNILSSFADLRPYHLLGYSVLLGTEIFQTFFVTKICHQVLPRSAFTTLQRKIFPVYFTTQTCLIAFLILTYPPFSFASLANSRVDAALLTAAGILSLLNLFRYGPGTASVMQERIHQGIIYEMITKNEH
jgi:hypothetical protein